jgi:predicted DCC family thiol-disulfide oxidoreductase YuxK
VTATLLYDGHCNLCSATVGLLLRLDRDAVLRFAPLQSDFARRALASHDLDPAHTGSVVLLAADRAHVRSDAVLTATAFLPNPWCQLRHFRHIPRGLRDRIYDGIAGVRYRLFGRRGSCYLPPRDRRTDIEDPPSRA